MDSRQEFQPFLPKANGKISHLSSHPYRDKQEEENEETFDLSWLFGVVRRRIAIMATATIALSVFAGGVIIAASKTIPTEYEGAFALLVEPATAEGLLSKQLDNTVAADLAKINIEGISLVDYETQIRILRSPKMMDPVIEDLKKWYPQITYQEVMSKLSINRISYTKDGKQAGTKILEVKYKDKDRKRIYGILEKISKAYLAYSLEQRLTGINQGIKFIELELPKLRERVNVIQLQMQNLRQSKNLYEPGHEGKSLTEQVAGLQSQRATLQIQIGGLQSTYENYQKLLDDKNPVGILMSQGQAYSSLLGSIQQVDAELSRKAAQYRDDSLPIVALRQTRNQLIETATRQAQRVVMSNLATQIRDLKARDRALGRTLENLYERIRTFASTTRQYDNLQQELQVVTKLLSDFLGKREALRIDGAQQQIPWQMINPPDIPRNKQGQFIPASVKQTKKQLALAVILSSLLGIAIGLLVEVLNTVFHSPDELRQATKLPVLGVIPLTKKNKQRLAKRPPRRRPSKKGAGPISDATSVNSPTAATLAAKNHSEMDYTFMEAFRSLYTNLHLLSSGRSIRSLIICSPVAGDGKSTVALHLARTAASVGQRVLLIDADLRCPQLHLRLGLPNVRGLSDAISTDLSLNDAIQRSSLEDNLFVLTSGQIVADPIKLLSSKKMQYLMEQFQAFFDLVIYDTPPLIGLADAHILAAHTDGTVMIVQMAQTDRAQVRKGIDELKISGANILGVVANGYKGSSKTANQRQVGLESLYTANNNLPVLDTKNN